MNFSLYLIIGQRQCADPMKLLDSSDVSQRIVGEIDDFGIQKFLWHLIDAIHEFLDNGNLILVTIVGVLGDGPGKLGKGRELQ